jgi:uncharacterized protein (DUF433 family)
VTLDSIVHEFNHGAAAEQIQDDFPTLSLREICATIAYYLGQPETVEDYLKRRERQAQETRLETEEREGTRLLDRRVRQRYAELKASR